MKTLTTTDPFVVLDPKYFSSYRSDRELVPEFFFDVLIQELQHGHKQDTKPHPALISGFTSKVKAEMHMEEAVYRISVASQQLETDCKPFLKATLEALCNVETYLNLTPFGRLALLTILGSVSIVLNHENQT